MFILLILAAITLLWTLPPEAAYGIILVLTSVGVSYFLSSRALKTGKSKEPTCPPHKYIKDHDGELICSLCPYRPKDNNGRS